MGEEISGCSALWGVAKGLVDPLKPEGERGATRLCLFFAGENGLEAEAVSVLTARDLGMIETGLSDLGVAGRGGVEGGRSELPGSDLVAFPSLKSFL